MARIVDHEIVIIGSGFAGLGMAITLQRAGRRFTVLERAGDVGGMWRDNRYPGSAATEPSRRGEYSFEPNPYWSRAYPPADEMQDYLLYCAEKYGVTGCIQFDSSVQQLQFDEGLGVWGLSIGHGDGAVSTATAGTVVLAPGPLGDPVLPDLPGLETFDGQLTHTAHWDPTLAVYGRRVGVIGTGCSAVQAIPPLAQDAQHLTVFQRTPSWVLPAANPAYAESLADTYEKHPGLMRAHRATSAAALAPRSSRHPVTRALAVRTARRHLERSVPDPDLRERLTPAPGCTRLLRSTDYYPTLAREDVTVCSSPITGVDHGGVATADGAHHDVDLLVFATGFDASGPYRYLGVQGTRGHRLHDDWVAGDRPYLGLTMPHHPNLFLIGAPTGAAGGTSAAAIEAQACQVVRLLAERDRRGCAVVRVRPEVAAGHAARSVEFVDYEFTGVR